MTNQKHTHLPLFDKNRPFKLNLDREGKNDIAPCYVTEEMEEQWCKEGRFDLLKPPIYTQPYKK